MPQVLYSHGVGAIYLFIVCFLNDQLTGGVIVCFKSPHVLFLILAFSVSGYFGVSFVMTLVGRFGAVIAVTVTSCRKALTIFLSFVFFPKPFSATYGVAGVRDRLDSLTDGSDCLLHWGCP
mmetsp:Transcript_47311/g.102738  ORF Transcript_47311/g.102738 Transcript_47311/m.102738 type:complete len:121 (-) Transcript_47311:574-936(-)